MNKWSKDNTNPGCLVELGYITNTDDLKKKQDDIAKELFWYSSKLFIRLFK